VNQGALNKKFVCRLLQSLTKVIDGEEVFEEHKPERSLLDTASLGGRSGKKDWHSHEESYMKKKKNKFEINWQGNGGGKL
jgi:hypothetical protein